MNDFNGFLQQAQESFRQMTDQSPDSLIRGVSGGLVGLCFLALTWLATRLGVGTVRRVGRVYRWVWPRPPPDADGKRLARMIELAMQRGPVDDQYVYMPEIQATRHFLLFPGGSCRVESGLFYVNDKLVDQLLPSKVCRPLVLQARQLAALCQQRKLDDQKADAASHIQRHLRGEPDACEVLEPNGVIPPSHHRSMTFGPATESADAVAQGDNAASPQVTCSRLRNRASAVRPSMMGSPPPENRQA